MRSYMAVAAALLLASTALAQPTPTPAAVRGAAGRVGPAPSPGSPEQPKTDQTPAAGQPAPEKCESAAQKAIRFAVGWDAEKAKATLESVPADTRSGADFRVASALEPMAEGKLDTALAAVGKAATDFPADPAPEYYRGEMLYWKGNLQGAEAAWKAAVSRAQAELAKNPKKGWASYYLGTARLQLRQFGLAKEALNAALANGASQPLVRYQLGLLAAGEQRWQDAVDEFTAALTEDSGLAYAYYYRGLAWSKLKRTDLLLLDMDRFLTLAPESPDAVKARSVLQSSKR